MTKQQFILLILISICPVLKGQTVDDLFHDSEVKITYLGIDYSHVKLIGVFSHIGSAGKKNVLQIRDTYFPIWNMVIVNERSKYDLSGMLRKPDIYYDIDMISAINSRTDLEGLVSYNTEKFTPEQIDTIVANYGLQGKEGIGIVFIAECLNKSQEVGIFHFVAIQMNTGKVLFHRRLSGRPHGFGLKNYWVNSIYKIIEDVKFYYFDEWSIKAKTADGLQAKEKRITDPLFNLEDI